MNTGVDVECLEVKTFIFYDPGTFQRWIHSLKHVLFPVATCWNPERKFPVQKKRTFER